MKLKIFGTTHTALVLFLALYPAQSLAWDCKAESSADDAYGFSYGMESQSDAQDRAISECEARTSESGSCGIAECADNGTAQDTGDSGQGTWSCTASSSYDDAYGYSHSYDNQSDAQDRAVSECEQNTGESGSCSVSSCNQE